MARKEISREWESEAETGERGTRRRKIILWVLASEIRTSLFLVEFAKRSEQTKLHRVSLASIESLDLVGESPPLNKIPTVSL